MVELGIVASSASLTYYVPRSATDRSKGPLSGVISRTNDLSSYTARNTSTPKLDTTSTALTTTEITHKRSVVVDLLTLKVASVEKAPGGKSCTTPIGGVYSDLHHTDCPVEHGAEASEGHGTLERLFATSNNISENNKKGLTGKLSENVETRPENGETSAKGSSATKGHH